MKQYGSGDGGVSHEAMRQSEDWDEALRLAGEGVAPWKAKYQPDPTSR